MLVELISGKVYIAHWNSNPSPKTSPQHGVSLGTVEKGELPVLLEESVKACCGVRRKKYHLASAGEVSVWFTGHINEVPQNIQEEK